MPNYPLRSKTLFVTGGASGIGAEVARQAASRGAHVAIVDKNGAGAQQVADGLPGAIALEADVRDGQSLAAAASETVSAFGGIDVVVANAGIELNGTGAGAPLDEIERIVDINLTGVFRTIKATASHVIDRRGYVLITSSYVAMLHFPTMGHYVATKAGVEAFGDALRIELMHRGVDVGIAYFAGIDTPMAGDSRATEIYESYLARHGENALGRTYPVGGAGRAVVSGIERRSRRVVYPRWVRATIGLRSIVPRLAEKRLARQDIAWLVDRFDERDV